MRSGLKAALGALGLGALVLGIVPGIGTATASAKTATGKKATAELLYIGMQGAEVRAARLDPATGALSAIGVVAQATNPFWFTEHPRLPILYAATEGAAGTPRTGTIIAYKVDHKSGALAPVGEAKTGGGGPTHLEFDAPSRTLLTANFGGGSASAVAINADGTPGALRAEVKDVGTGPMPRQSAPHAHGVTLAPGRKFALVADLGSDKVFVYPFDAAKGTLLLPPAGSEHHLTVAPGSGPRHVVFHPNGRIAYLVNELSAGITVLRWNGAAGTLAPVQTLSTDRPEFTGVRSASEIAVSADGRFVYVANRSEGALLTYRIDPASGELTQIQRIGSGGPSPWAFSFDRTGRWLVVAEQGLGKLVVFAVNRRTGLLTPTAQTLDTPKPVAITFVR
jgi:6-phosphogluconolactonase